VRKSHAVLITIAIIIAAVFFIQALGLNLGGLLNWGLLTAVLAALVCLAIFFEFEAAAAGSKELALVAMLGTASAVLRVPFAAIPGLQPCTFLIICSGYVFGPMAGFVVGAMTPLVSNFFLGHGPWTLYQMTAWGLAGLSSGYLRRFSLNRPLLVVLGLIWGYLYGLITDLWYWASFIYPLTFKTLIVTQLSSIWFDTLHAAGNAILLGTLGVKTIAVLNRFRERFSINVS
jgi:energy-coupling factor transport system substrate-specific component